jgi:hypothetical protein
VCSPSIGAGRLGNSQSLNFIGLGE